MSSWQILGLVILAVGIVLLVLGLQATETFSEEIRQEFTGEYSSDTTWYIALGIGGIVVGGGLVLLGGRLKHRA